MTLNRRLYGPQAFHDNPSPASASRQCRHRTPSMRIRVRIPTDAQRGGVREISGKTGEAAHAKEEEGVIAGGLQEAIEHTGCIIPIRDNDPYIAPIYGVYSIFPFFDQIFTITLPKFCPLMRRWNAAGAFSRPTVKSSRWWSFPWANNGRHSRMYSSRRCS